MNPVATGVVALVAVYGAAVYVVLRSYQPGTGRTRGVSALHLVLGLTFVAMAVAVYLVTRGH